MPMPPGQHARDMWVHFTRRLLGRRPSVRRGGGHGHVPASESVPPPKWVLPSSSSGGRDNEDEHEDAGMQEEVPVCW